jgi:hypothetical protein
MYKCGWWVQVWVEWMYSQINDHRVIAVLCAVGVGVSDRVVLYGATAPGWRYSQISDEEWMVCEWEAGGGGHKSMITVGVGTVWEVLTNQ